jgi:hypothetical protein
VHAAIFRFRSRTGIGSAPPQPGSVVAISVIGFGALVVHVSWALLSAINDAWCASSASACVTVSFEPNVYKTLFAAGETLAKLGATDAMWVLAATLLLTIGSYVVASGFEATAFGRRRLRGLQYGWLADLVELAEVEGRFTTAFVVTTATHDGVALGYEGFLENLSVNADKEITSLTLLDVSRFTLDIGEARRTDIDARLIPRLYIPRSSVQNVAFNVFELDDEVSGQGWEESLPAVHGNP